MERSTMIIIAIVLIAILVLGILSIVYYVKHKNKTSVTESASSEPQSPPESVVTFNEVQNDDVPLNLSITEEDVNDENTENTEDVRDVSQDENANVNDEDTYKQYNQPPTEHQPAEYVSNTTVFNSSPQSSSKLQKSYTSVGVEYPIITEDDTPALSFQFSSKQTEE